MKSLTKPFQLFRSLAITYLVLTVPIYGLPDEETAKPQKVEIASFVTDAGVQIYRSAVEEPHKKVLMLPGIACTDYLYRPYLRSTTLHAHGVQIWVANPPAFKGMRVPTGFDMSVEAYADMIEDLDHAEEFDVIVGHSYFGNVLAEIASRGNFDGSLVIISPTLRAEDDAKLTQLLAKVSRSKSAGYVASKVTQRMLSGSFKEIIEPKHRDRLWSALVAEANKGDAARIGELYDSFFLHIGTHGDLGTLILASDSPVWFVRGQNEAVGFSSATRRAFKESERINLIEIEDSRHFPMLEEPGAFAQQVLLPALGFAVPQK